MPGSYHAVPQMVNDIFIAVINAIGKLIARKL